jgi:hypothetical protein
MKPTPKMSSKKTLSSTLKGSEKKLLIVPIVPAQAIKYGTNQKKTINKYSSK